MSRLFITPRELNFISDITKELIKDLIGQKIYYYPISETKTLTVGIYNEAIKKVFDNPIIIDALVDAQYQIDTKIGKYGVDQQYKLELFVQYRDIVEKGINIQIGDFFSFNDVFYEITEEQVMRNIYGLPEHKDGVKIVGLKAREEQFKALLMGPTDFARPEDDAVQKTFEQQRGQSLDSRGEPTGDVRDLVRAGVLDPPLTGAREVSSRGDPDGVGSSFYDEDP